MSGSDDESSIGSNSDYESSGEDSPNGYTIDLTSDWQNDSLLNGSILDGFFTEDMLKVVEEERSENDSLYFDFDACNEIYLNDQPSQCTYKEGYMKRQNIYTCADCNTKNNQLSAICFSCAMCCHRKHNILELYSKRNFRCDCGNEKFDLFNCKLCPEKELFNRKNVYNDNFRGIYCVCKQPYDNNSRDMDDTMIQCVICEDWYHTKHLDVEPPKDSEGKFCFDEFICFLCASKHAYLTKYKNFPIKDEFKQNKETDIIERTDECCIVKDVVIKLPYSSLYLPSGWRDNLCRCNDCMSIYQHHQHMFLLDHEDVLLNDGEIFDFVRSSVNTPIEEPTEQIQEQTTPLSVISACNSVNTDKDSQKQPKPIENNTSTDKTENNPSPDTSIKEFLKNIHHKKRPVKVTDPSEVVKEYQRKKRPKCDDDDQNL